MRTQVLLLGRGDDMTVHDRGAKKWTSLMLPEHIEMLKEWERSLNKVEKPILAEDEVLEINRILMHSLMTGEEIVIRQWVEGFFEYISPVKVTNIDVHKKKVYGLVEGDEQAFLFDHIVGAKLM